MSKDDLFDRLKIIALICLVMIGVHILNIITSGYLRSFGLQPRDISSIYTIATSPWLHGDINHLIGNLSIMIVLAFICLLQGTRYFVRASMLIILLSGIMLWLFGRDANHIGASSWIFGLWSLVIALAWFDRSFINIAISIGVIFFYGGLVVGLMPTAAHISFEGHIFGAIAGVISAAILSKTSDRTLQKTNRSGEIKFWS